jgi:hypothetical protein
MRRARRRARPPPSGAPRGTGSGARPAWVPGAADRSVYRCQPQPRSLLPRRPRCRGTGSPLAPPPSLRLTVGDTSPPVGDSGLPRFRRDPRRVVHLTYSWPRPGVPGQLRLIRDLLRGRQPLPPVVRLTSGCRITAICEHFLRLAYRAGADCPPWTRRPHGRRTLSIVVSPDVGIDIQQQQRRIRHRAEQGVLP